MRAIHRAAAETHDDGTVYSAVVVPARSFLQDEETFDDGESVVYTQLDLNPEPGGSTGTVSAFGDVGYPRLDSSVNPQAAPWYHGAIHESIGADFLTACPPGSFLVRQHGVDVRFELMMVGRNGLVQKPISRRDKMYSLENSGRANDIGSKTLAGLIDELRVASELWASPLAHFIPRLSATPSAIEKEILHADEVRGSPLKHPSLPIPPPASAKISTQPTTPRFLLLLQQVWATMTPAPDNTVDGQQVRQVVLRSGLEHVVLGALWSKVDTKGAGSLDYTQFGYLLGLIAQRQRKEPLDKSKIGPNMEPPVLEGFEVHLASNAICDPPLSLQKQPEQPPPLMPKLSKEQPPPLPRKLSISSRSEAPSPDDQALDEPPPLPRKKSQSSLSRATSPTEGLNVSQSVSQTTSPVPSGSRPLSRNNSRPSSAASSPVMMRSKPSSRSSSRPNSRASPQTSRSSSRPVSRASSPEIPFTEVSDGLTKSQSQRSTSMSTKPSASDDGKEHNQGRARSMKQPTRQQSNPQSANPSNRHVYEQHAPLVIEAARAAERKEGKRPESVYIEKEKIEIGNRWYAGKVNRQICDSAIADAKHGDFLVRESSSSNNMVLVVHDAGQVTNFPVERCNGKIKLGTVVVNTIDELIEGLKQVPLTSPRSRTPLKLGHPVSLQDNTYSLVQFAQSQSRDQYVDMRPKGAPEIEKRETKSKRSIFGSRKKKEAQTLDSGVEMNTQKEPTTKRGNTAFPEVEEHSDFADAVNVQKFLDAREADKAVNQSTEALEATPPYVAPYVPPKDSHRASWNRSSPSSPNAPSQATELSPFKKVRNLLMEREHLWLFPDLNRQDMEEWFKDEGPGTFVCRKSTRFKSCWALAVKTKAGGVANLLIREHDNPLHQSGYMIKGASVLYTSLAILMARLITDADLRSKVKLAETPVVPESADYPQGSTGTATSPLDDKVVEIGDEWAAMKSVIWDDEGDTEA